MDGQFFTWQALTAMSGASLLTFFIVQYTKSLIDRYLRLPTDIYAVMIAYLVLLSAQLATGANGSDWPIYVLTFANAFLVAAAAGHIQAKSIDPPVLKDKGTGASAVGQQERSVIVNQTDKRLEDTAVNPVLSATQVEGGVNNV
jgi:hypothetical protein